MSLNAYVVDRLEPDTLYKFYAMSLTAAGASYENSSLVEATTESAGIVAGHIAAITVTLCVLLVFVIIGAVTCIRYVISALLPVWLSGLVVSALGI